MPRVSQAHEQEVRGRIVRASLGVFAERGFHRATMQDIVRASGLSVGAIYTYFKSKSDLILAGCDLITDQELAQLGERLAGVTDYRDRIAAAVGYWFDNLAVEQSDGGSGFLLLQAWAEVETDPAIRQMLLHRRHETITAIVLVLQEGVIRDELPAWLDVASLAHALAALLDGTLIQAAEEGAAYRRADHERRILALFETILAAKDAAAPERITPAEAAPYESVRARRVAS
ncbi:MAG TPA: TetR/AcrR family transcriptional regulator [Candidatus Limnocylindrales bacterium]|nr:TetR/AcrR family transcriptional regulator [Candidatus Limnocylindrales bacterium]